MSDISIYKTGYELIQFITKRWWIILIITSIGTSMGYVRGSKTPPVYETQLIGESKDISNAAVVGVINTLASSANTNNYKQLSAQLNLKDDITKYIWALDAKIFTNTNPTENLNNNVFYVTVRTSNLSKIPTFIKGLTQYVNNDILFKKKGLVSISSKFNIPKNPVNGLSKTLLKYGIVFFILGIVIAIGISFISNVIRYSKTTDNG